MKPFLGTSLVLVRVVLEKLSHSLIPVAIVLYELLFSRSFKLENQSFINFSMPKKLLIKIHEATAILQKNICAILNKITKLYYLSCTSLTKQTVYRYNQSKCAH